MKKTSIAYLIPILMITGILIASNFKKPPKYISVSSNDFVKESSSDENYKKMMDVLVSPRCINCHPNDNIPKQGDDGHPHYFGMSRGDNNLGYQATKCTTCHQSENNDYSGVPGAPEWSLAPASMMWEGLSRKEIAESMLDPERNGGRNHEELMHHLTEHALVLWAWEPGVRADGTPRKLPPVPLDEYIKAVKEWFEDGAIIPAK
ncbi:hypothetical protein [Aquimarina litoralis]|uniref:hypothetical protein n=1 Tax=Aquimarina litoralis TaxID=584605 RepID=UPI001C56ED9D|nr:hypothetical protein [Aquimarina litoralis]MBW1294455.1 hypothetical protein [Aquimarina litoralis]